MPTEYLKAAVIAAWVLAVATLGFGLGVTSFPGWAVLAVLSFVPPAIMLRLWSVPARTTSENIRDVLR